MRGYSKPLPASQCVQKKYAHTHKHVQHNILIHSHLRYRVCIDNVCVFLGCFLFHRLILYYSYISLARITNVNGQVWLNYKNSWNKHKQYSKWELSRKILTVCTQRKTDLELYQIVNEQLTINKHSGSLLDCYKPFSCAWLWKFTLFQTLYTTVGTLILYVMNSTQALGVCVCACMFR